MLCFEVGWLDIDLLYMVRGDWFEGKKNGGV